MVDIDKRLMEAAQSGSEAELKALLRVPGCNALTADHRGWTALMHAIYGGHEACVRLLLPVSAALSQSDNGMTALMHAARSSRESCIKILLPASDALTQDKDGWTALMWATYFGHEECVSLLLPVSDALARDGDGFTASDWARKGNREILALFIDAYALAQSEHAVIKAAASTGAPSKKSKLRV